MTTPPPFSYFPPPPPPHAELAAIADENPPQPTTARDGGAGVRVVCWLLIAALVLIEVLANLAQEKSALAVPATQSTTAAKVHEAAEQNIAITIGGRYVVAVNAWAKDRGNSIPTLISQLDQQAKTTIDQIDVAIVSRELEPPARADERFTAIRRSARLTRADRNTLATLQKIDADGPASIAKNDRKVLVDRLGWFGKLALVHRLPANDPGRMALIADTHRLIIATTVTGVLMIIVLLAGVGLLIVAIVLGSMGRIRLRYRRAATGSVYLEIFALYMLTFFLMQLILPLVIRKAPLAWEVAVLFCLIPIALIWPMIRGESWQSTRMNLGWHRGEGVLKEMAAGVTMYIASLPLLALAFLITQLLIKAAQAMHWAGASPSHPIVRYLTGSPGTVVVIYLLASVCAPVLEETMFRGALFNHLRGRHGWWLSALVVSIIFAAIHPQGWTLIPVLGGLAMSFAAMREWRSSLIPSMTAHAINNGVVITIAILMLR